VCGATDRGQSLHHRRRTDSEAQDIGRKAWPTFYENFIKLWRKHGTEPVNAKLPPSFDQLAESGHAIAGSAKTVAQMLSDQVSAGGVNYVIGSFMFGTMPHADVTARSVASPRT